MQIPSQIASYQNALYYLYPVTTIGMFLANHGAKSSVINSFNLKKCVALLSRSVNALIEKKAHSVTEIFFCCFVPFRITFL